MADSPSGTTARVQRTGAGALTFTADHGGAAARQATRGRARGAFGSTVDAPAGARCPEQAPGGLA